MIAAAGNLSPSERQLRIINMISGIDDSDLLDRIEHMIDLHRSGLRAIDEAEMQAILDDLRPEGEDRSNADD
ncbi:MAG: hypothetical protein U5J97_06200 [Trueperaceae bacterium]|nr:hypothetical protein [Trueperaceae bacterium]